MFSFLAIGDWGSDQVRTTWGENSRQHVREVEKLIEQTWSTAVSRPVGRLFDGPMCRLEHFSATPDSLLMRLSKTSYRIFYGTNLTHPEVGERHGRNAMANPVGLSAALVTADGYMLFGRRNSAVAYYPGRVHPFAGSLEPSDGSDVFAALRRELGEELRLGPTDLTDIRLCGIVEDHALLHPELIFRARTRRTRQEILRQIDAAEHHAGWAIPATAAPSNRRSLTRN